MKVWRGVTLGFWVMLITACVSLIAVYYILSQTILNPTSVKKWLDQSGAYSQLGEAVVPMLTTGETSTPSSSLLTNEMVSRAAKSSLRPADIKAKVEPVIDATYAWLDSKSPEITFSISTAAETERFLEALRREVRTKIESLPECSSYVDPATLEQADCLPWYVSAESATEGVMARVGQRDLFRDKKLTPDNFASTSMATSTARLPEIISLLWIVQLIAMPVAGITALFLIAKRRASGLIAVAVSLLLPGLGLLALGLLFYLGGGATVANFVEKSELAAVAQPLGKVIAASLAAITLQVSGIFVAIGIALGAGGILWRKRQLRRVQ